MLGEIVREGGEPVWRQIADQIIAGIRSGEYPPGSPIPSTNDLSFHFGVAYETARHAVRAVVAANLAYPVRGKGTFVVGTPRFLDRPGAALVADALRFLDAAGSAFGAEGDEVSRDVVFQAAHALRVNIGGVVSGGQSAG